MDSRPVFPEDRTHDRGYGGEVTTERVESLVLERVPYPHPV